MMNHDTIDALTGLFEILKGGSLVAVSADRIPESVRLVIENRARLSGIADSWGRVVVTLTGCRRFAFRTEDSAPRADLPELASRLKPALLKAGKRDDFCEVGCACGLMHGTLEIAAEDFSIMLGSGRTPGFDEFLEELDLRGDAPYSMAS